MPNDMLDDWTVVFEFNRQPLRRNTPFESQWHFKELTHGFWLNEQHDLVREDRGFYWIPPSRIYHIERYTGPK